MERAAFVVGQPVQATIRITNQSDKAVTVLKPTLLNKDPVELSIIRADGSTAEYANLWATVRRTLVSLAPGKSVEEIVNISEFYKIGAPGEYKIYAIYKLEEPDSSIKSDEVIVRIERPNGKFQESLSIVPKHSDGSAKGKVNWHVFTHKVDNTTRVYCRRFIELLRRKKVVWEVPMAFVDLGEPRYEETVSCLVDTAGKLHVLFQPVKEAEDIYAHTVLSTLGESESMHLYRPAKDSKPSLATRVYVEYAQMIQPRDESK